ncbi:CotH kinase family protein [Cystobacter fuscus]|nr:CotH kinase family protein [Cystobacter fuscus]
MFARVNKRLPLACLVALLAACSPPTPEPEAPGKGPPASPGEPVPPGPTEPSGPPPGTEVPCEMAPVEAAAPVMERPAPEAWVVPGELVLHASGFEDSGGAAPGRAHFEVWSVEDDAPGVLVWSATVSAPEARLSEGRFESTRAGLSERTRYAARVRYAYGSSTCEAWGPWSGFRLFRTEDGSAQLFDEARVLEFHLDIPPDSWAAMNAQAVPPDCVPHERDDHRATLRFGAQVFENVGVHVKGGCGSARTLEGKSSFKVDLEWDDPAVPGGEPSRELLGRKNFTFDNNVQDPSFMNERLGFAFFRAMGVPAPRAASVRLFVNGEPWGLYTHVETIDRRFLARWFEDKDGALYEGSYWCDLLAENMPAPGEDASGYCLERKLGGGSPAADGYAPLRELTRRLEGLGRGGFYPEVLAFFDYDRFLTTWAIEGVISHWDGYSFDTRNNYRVYEDPSTGRWTLIPGGIDQTFGHRQGSKAGTVQDPWAVTGLLAARCLEEADCRAAYATRLEEVTRAFESAGLEERVRRMREQLAGHVRVDPRKETTFEGFERAVEATLRFIRERPVQVRGTLPPSP